LLLIVAFCIQSNDGRRTSVSVRRPFSSTFRRPFGGLRPIRPVGIFRPIRPVGIFRPIRPVIIRPIRPIVIRPIRPIVIRPIRPPIIRIRPIRPIIPFRPVIRPFLGIPLSAGRICNLPHKYGFCSSSLQRWLFDPSLGKCVPFLYSGCGGNLNNFDLYSDCMKACA